MANTTFNNVASGSKLASVGIVKNLVGAASATDASGVSRPLQVGDKVYANEVIRTADGGTILIAFANGAFANLGHGDSLALTPDVFGAEAALAPSEGLTPAQAAEQKTDIADIQAKIAAGFDPTQVTEAASAGPTAGGAGGGSEGGSSFVVVDQLAAQGEVTSGYPTGPISVAFQSPQAELGIPVEEEIVPPVVPPEVVLTITVPDQNDYVGSNGEVVVVPGDVTVFEQGLVSESNSEVASGTFSFVSSAGMTQLVVGGVPIALADVLSLGTAPVSIPSGEGTLVLNGFVGDANGGTVSFTYTLLDNLLHAEGQGANSLFDAIEVSVTDVLANTSTAAIDVNIVDDLPTLDVELDEGMVPSLVTHDAETIGAASDVAPAEGSAAFAELFNLSANMGADTGGSEPQLTYTLAVASGMSDTGLASDGAPITLAVEAGTGDLVGSTSSAPIFRIHVDTDGNVTLTQYAQIDHLDAGGNPVSSLGLPAGTVLLSAAATIVDSDGDSVSDSQALDVSGAFSFADDVPSVAPQNAVLANQLNAMVTGSLNLDLGADNGSASDVRITGATNSDGYAIDSDGNVLESNGSPLYYYTAADGTLYATTTEGSSAGAVFTVNPDPATGTYTVELIGTLDAPVKTFHSDFGTTDPGGPNDPYRSFFTAEDGTTQRVDIFGLGEPEAKPSADGLGIGGNVVMKSDQLGIYFGTNVNSATVTVGNFKGSSFDWKAIDISDAAAAQIAALPDLDPDATTAWTLQEFYDSITISGSDVFAKLAADGAAVDIGNVVDGDTVPAPGDLGQSETYPVDLNPDAPFDLLYMTPTSESDAFKVEQISFAGDSVSSPVSVDLLATATDADLDAASDSFQVVFSGNTNGEYTLVGTGGDDVLAGSAGADTFVFQPNGGHDTVTDFDPAADVLHISDVLVSAGLISAEEAEDGSTLYTALDDLIGVGLTTAAADGGASTQIVMVNGSETTPIVTLEGLAFTEPNALLDQLLGASPEDSQLR